MSQRTWTPLVETLIRPLEYLSVVVFLLTIGVAQLRVVDRFLPSNFPIHFPWASQFATVLLVVVVFIGAAVAAVREENIVITVFRNFILARTGPVVGAVYRGAIGALSLVVIAIIALASYEQAVQSWDGILFHTIPWVKRGYLYGLLFVSFLIAGVKILADGIKRFRETELAGGRVQELLR